MLINEKNEQIKVIGSKVLIPKTCPSCGTLHWVTADLVGWEKYRAGTPADEVWPDWDEMKFQVFELGICPSCWLSVNRVG